MERILPEGKKSSPYKLIKTKDEYKGESHVRFEMLFKQLVMIYLKICYGIFIVYFL